MLDYELDKVDNPDHVATPRGVVENIYELINIKKFNNIGFPFDNYDSEFNIVAKELELSYKATHLFDSESNDYYKCEPPLNCDLMISNPPFSEQNKVITRAFDLVEQGKIKSFALLLPLRSLETPTRTNLYEKHNDKISFKIFKKRIKFKGHKVQFNQGILWLLYNIEQPNQISGI